MSVARRVALVAMLLGGCGYRVGGAPADAAGPFTLTGGPALVPEASAIAALEAGARGELARAGQLGGCAAATSGRPAGCAAVVVDLLRVEEGPAGVRRALPVEGESPVARGVRVVLTGRARLRGRDGSFIRDSGDMSSEEVFAREVDVASASRSRLEATRLAARRLGERLVRRLLGRPEASIE